MARRGIQRRNRMEQLLPAERVSTRFRSVRCAASVMTAVADWKSHQVHIQIRTHVLFCFYYLYASATNSVYAKEPRAQARGSEMLMIAG